MEPLKHECGVAMIRLLKPLSYYQQKYGTWMYGLNKMYLLMEKQHNRGQEGAGLAAVRLQAAPGEEYMFRQRALGSGAITEIFQGIASDVQTALTASGQPAAGGVEQIDSISCIPFAGELLMGHLRYSTTGKSGLSYVHPFLRRNNWRAKNLCLCGNFNMTNVDGILETITSCGQHPREQADTYILLEQIGHRLDRESERLFKIAHEELHLTGQDITHYIEDHIDLANVLRTSAPAWDGGYVICGITGSGEMMSMRDPWGIRPAFWYKNDEVVVLTSERPVIQTAFELEADQIHELMPGQALLVDKRGQMRIEQILPAQKLSACSFERIYFSRGSDVSIYQERKTLGAMLKEPIMQAIDGDLKHTVFSFIPNTAEVAFYGMLSAFKDELNCQKAAEIAALDHKPTLDELHAILCQTVRSEKVAWKDIKLRTFITEAGQRNDLSAHVYDITYGSIVSGEDTLVVIDDSIVRGTTLKESIIRILNRLHPRKIVLVSSSPQVRYPDYYGIDMPHMDEFIAFRAAIELLHDRGQWEVIHDVYRRCRENVSTLHGEIDNPVRSIYTPCTQEEISAKMVEMLRPQGVTTPITIVFQTLEGLHKACPAHPGDWYFSGHYPTQGGTRLINEAYIDWYEHKYSR